MANEEQIEYWNSEAGETWVEVQERIDGIISELTERAINAADPRPGERALDIGCGCGTSTLALAERGAMVHGVDISQPMLARAKERAQGLDNVAFTQADAATQPFTPDHQLVFSRFGVMFFSDPVTAFTNINSALASDGRLYFICWQSPQNNPWMSVAGAAIQPFLPEPEVPPDPRAPGPFAFADPAYVKDILSAAGFSDIEMEGMTAEVNLGTLEEAMSFLRRLGPPARALKELHGDPQERALAAAQEALAAYLTEDGLRLGSAAWLVSARK
ncbi:MAG: class I SAM-dependent methyltransferase [Pseudomonadales bacterium]